MAFLLPIACCLGSALIGGTLTGVIVASQKNSTIKQIAKREENERRVRKALQQAPDNEQVQISYSLIYSKIVNGQVVQTVEDKQIFKGKLRAWKQLQKSRMQQLKLQGFNNCVKY